ncbi:MAG: MBL fold metallo-hydrolase, partial [Acidobacteriota bacterium]|nr:MBL fold metallo-hydrolase [Acidobacteriota bacterium]
MRFIFEQLRLGGDRNFAYLLGDREAGEGLLVDPSFDPAAAVARARAQGLRITAILNTHGHADHTNGNAGAQALTGAPVLGGPGHPGPLDRTLKDGDRIPFGGFAVKVWQVPGHTVVSGGHSRRRRWRLPHSVRASASLIVPPTLPTKSRSPVIPAAWRS